MDKLGKMLKDKLSGFTGIAQAYEIGPYAMGRYHIDGSANEKNEISNGYSFDDIQLEIVDDALVVTPLPIEPTTFNFLDEVEDVLSGFRGKIASKLVYINGCVRWRVVPPYKTNKDDDDSHRNIPDKQLKLIKSAKAVTTAPKSTGGPTERSTAFRE